MIRIAFAGPRASGKSTLARHLASVYEVERLSLATPIKRIIAERPTDTHDRHARLWAWSDVLFLQNLSLQAKFVSRASLMLRHESDPGRLAQQLGALGRELEPDVWLRYLLDRLPEGDAVVDDVRYRNEVEGLRAAGFALIRLHAPSEVLAERVARRGDDRRDPHHESEHALPDGPYDAEWDTSEPLEITLSRLDRLVETLSKRAG